VHVFENHFDYRITNLKNHTIKTQKP